MTRDELIRAERAAWAREDRLWKIFGDKARDSMVRILCCAGDRKHISLYDVQGLLKTVGEEVYALKFDYDRYREAAAERHRAVAALKEDTPCQLETNEATP